jgi:hypothetical protein
MDEEASLDARVLAVEGARREGALGNADGGVRGRERAGEQEQGDRRPHGPHVEERSTAGRSESVIADHTARLRRRRLLRRACRKGGGAACAMPARTPARARAFVGRVTRDTSRVLDRLEVFPGEAIGEGDGRREGCLMDRADPPRRSLRHRATRVLACALLLLAALPAAGGPREQAKRLHDRLVGVPPDAATLDAMAARIASGDALGAAYLAMRDPSFYRTSLKNWVTPWTNVERTVFADLNDYTTTVIGMIRDDVPFTEVLSADLVYVGAPGVVAPPYSHTDNDHYRELELQRVDLGDPALLVPVPQSTLPGSQLVASETAGVLTTRAAGVAFFSAGTNRRMWRFTAIHFLCRDMEELKDISRPVDRIRQDVSRSPGGDSTIFQNSCSGCHSGMDALAGAFAYFEFDETQQRVVHTRGVVQPKHLINSNVFPWGWITVDDRWDNYWREGANANLGWRGPSAGGFGAKTLGQEVAASRAFSACQVEKAFEHVCFRPPSSLAEIAQVERITDVFEAQGFSMKRVFAEVGAYCMGE